MQAADIGSDAAMKVSRAVSASGDLAYRLDLGQYLQAKEQELGRSRPKGETLVGVVERYYPRARAAGIILGKGARVVTGGRLHFKGAQTDYWQAVESLQRNRQTVARVDGPASVGLRMSRPVNAGDLVYRQ